MKKEKYQFKDNSIFEVCKNCKIPKIIMMNGNKMKIYESKKSINKEWNTGLLREILELKKGDKIQIKFYDHKKPMVMILKVEDLE